MAQYHHALSQAQLSKVTQGGYSQGGGVPGSLSAANLPHSSNIVTGGKITAGPSGSRGFHSGQGGSSGNMSMPSRKKWEIITKKQKKRSKINAPKFWNTSIICSLNKVVEKGWNR